MRGVLSIQSQVVYGHVGNTMAQVALSRLGHDIWPVPTVLFSNHPGHGGFGGQALPANTIAALITGMDERGMLSGTEAVLSGYLGAPDHTDVILDALRRVGAAAPKAFYLCDPVMGDAGKGLYVKPAIAEAIRNRLVPRADILKPNAFELGFLTGIDVTAPASAIEAARVLTCPLVVCSSVPIPPDHSRIGTMAITKADAWLVTAPHRDRPPPGTGDLFTALFLSHVLNGLTTPDALAAAASALDRVLDRPHGPEPEIPIVELQSKLIDRPEARLKVEQVSVPGRI